MKDFIFNTTATMKPYNKKKWWILPDVIRRKRIAAETLPEALELYREAVEEHDGIEISRNAIKNKQAMFRDTENGPKQIGYVITAKSDFRDDERHTWNAQYIDLWIEILLITEPEF